MVKLFIDKEFIGAVIGPGGKVIQEIQRETGTTINLEEKNNMGEIAIFSTNKEGVEKAVSWIKGIVAVPQVGDVYEATVKSIMPFGAFVEFLPGKQGLVHISEVSWKRLETLEGIVREGDVMKVKLIGTDPKSGKFKLSRKILIPKPDAAPRQGQSHSKKKIIKNKTLSNRGFLVLNMSEYIQIDFQQITSEQSDLLIAQLSSIGFEGFEEEENSLKAFIPLAAFDEALLKEITSGSNLSYSQSTIEETNWNAVWESNFDSVIVDDFVSIRADFHEQIKGVEHEILITPKMSFGTGHHATTYMMIKQMREIDFKDKTVFDFGTGTGVLAILAEKIGCR